MKMRKKRINFYVTITFTPFVDVWMMGHCTNKNFIHRKGWKNG